MATTPKTRRDPYKTLLLRKRSELLAEVRRWPEILAADIKSPDEVEFATRSAEQDLTARTANLRSTMLREIDGALERVAGGKYGVCECCGEDISPARLAAIPWARYCVQCQESLSRN